MTKSGMPLGFADFSFLLHFVLRLLMLLSLQILFEKGGVAVDTGEDVFVGSVYVREVVEHVGRVCFLCFFCSSSFPMLLVCIRRHR